MREHDADLFVAWKGPRYWLRSKLTCRSCGHAWTASYHSGVTEPPTHWECPSCHREHAGSIRSAADSEIFGTLYCERCRREFDRCEMRPGVRFPLKCPHCGRQALRLHPDVRLCC